MNHPLVIKSADLVIAASRVEQDVRTILHTLPQGKGWVFGLITIEHKDDIARERVAHIISSHLEHLSADLEQESNVVRRFEQALSRVNRDLTRAARELSLHFDRFNTVIGVLARGQIFLSGTGKLSALFLHKTAERRYVIYELDAQFHDEQNQSWDKPLVAVLDGELHPGDIFYLATPISRQALGMNELQDILVTLPPAGALQRIRQYLPPTEYYGAIAFHAMEEEKTGVVRKANPINSLQELEHTKERTANVLGDQQPDLVHTVKEVAAGISKKLSSPGMRGAQATGKRALGLVVKASSGIAAAGAKLFVTARDAMKRALEKSRTSSALKRGVSRNSRVTTKPGPLGTAFAFLGDLSLARKGALVAFMTVMVVFGGIIFINGGESEREQVETAFAASVESIENKILAAEASLIYRNTDEAKKTMEEAATALETLPRDTTEHAAEANRLAQSLATLQAKIRGITLVQPSELADLRSIESSASLLTATGTVGGVIALGDNLSAYKLDSIQGEWLKQDTINGPISRIESSTTVGPHVIFVDATQQLGRVDLAAGTINPITSGANGMASVEDITAYNDTLYALTSASQQVVKMRPQGTNFEAGTAWITARDTDLTTARALAIDANIYILTANDIVKFSSGREQDWQPATIDPPLAQPIDIWTSFESKYLYVLDPAEKRVLVLVKDTGAVQAQYVSDEFAQAVAFIVDEATSKIIVVTATKALEFTPQHLIK